MICSTINQHSTVRDYVEFILSAHFEVSRVPNIIKVVGLSRCWAMYRDNGYSSTALIAYVRSWHCKIATGQDYYLDESLQPSPMPTQRIESRQSSIGLRGLESRPKPQEFDASQCIIYDYVAPTPKQRKTSEERLRLPMFKHPQRDIVLHDGTVYRRQFKVPQLRTSAFVHNADKWLCMLEFLNDAIAYWQDLNGERIAYNPWKRAVRVTGLAKRVRMAQNKVKAKHKLSRQELKTIQDRTEEQSAKRKTEELRIWQTNNPESCESAARSCAAEKFIATVSQGHDTDGNYPWTTRSGDIEYIDAETVFMRSLYWGCREALTEELRGIGQTGIDSHNLEYKERGKINYYMSLVSEKYGIDAAELFERHILYGLSYRELAEEHALITKSAVHRRIEAIKEFLRNTKRKESDSVSAIRITLPRKPRMVGMR